MSSTLHRYRNWLFAVALVLLFWVANRAAYKGYFAADELDNLAWSHYTPWSDFLSWGLSPIYHQSNFRPIGHAFFKLTGDWFVWDFPRFLALVQLLHLGNVFLLWALLRRLQTNWAATAAATAFFAFHAATVAAYWKPMYVFDVLCTGFTLLALLAWCVQGQNWRHWLGVTLAFWAAYKCKEWAVAIPFVLLAYEWALGQRRWKPLLPMFFLAASFIVQGLIAQAGATQAYGIRLTPGTLWLTASTYSTALAGLPLVGFAVLLGLAWRNATARWGVLVFLLSLGPMLLVPGRLAPVYLYASLIGVAILAAACFARWPLAMWALLPWFAWQYWQLKDFRSTELYEASQRKSFVETLRQIAVTEPRPPELRFENYPRSLESWGTQGAVTRIWRETNPRAKMPEHWHEALQPMPAPPLGALWFRWDEATNRLLIDPVRPVTESLLMAPDVTQRRLGTGWLSHEGSYRWALPTATLPLLWRKDATRFFLKVNLGVKLRPKVMVRVLADGATLGQLEFVGDGLQESSFALPVRAGEDKVVTITLQASPVIPPHGEGGQALGIAVRALGFGR